MQFFPPRTLFFHQMINGIVCLMKLSCWLLNLLNVYCRICRDHLMFSYHSKVQCHKCCVPTHNFRCSQTVKKYIICLKNKTKYVNFNFFKMSILRVRCFNASSRGQTYIYVTTGSVTFLIFKKVSEVPRWALWQVTIFFTFNCYGYQLRPLGLFFNKIIEMSNKLAALACCRRILGL